MEIVAHHSKLLTLMLFFLIISMLMVLGCVEKDPRSTMVGQSSLQGDNSGSVSSKDYSENQPAKISLEGELSECEKIEDKWRREKDNCYQRVANIQEEPTVCEKIETSYIRDDCYRIIARDIQNSELCERIKEKFERRSCYKEVARATKNVKICENYHNTLWLEGCYQEVALALNDPSLCKKIKDSETSGECLDMIRQGISFCKDIGPGKKQYCYRSVALAHEKPALCKKIDSKSKKYMCYTNLAEATSNPSLCKKILWKEERRLCHIIVK